MRITAERLHDSRASIPAINRDMMEEHVRAVSAACELWNEPMAHASFAVVRNATYIATYGEHTLDTGLHCFEWIAVTGCTSGKSFSYYIAHDPRHVHVMHDEPEACERMYVAAKAEG